MQPFPNYKVPWQFSSFIDQAEGNLLTSLSDKIWCFSLRIHLLHHFLSFLCPIHDYHIDKPLLLKITVWTIESKRYAQNIINGYGNGSNSNLNSTDVWRISPGRVIKIKKTFHFKSDLQIQQLVWISNTNPSKPISINIVQYSWKDSVISRWK